MAVAAATAEGRCRCCCARKDVEVVGAPELLDTALRQRCSSSDVPALEEGGKTRHALKMRNALRIRGPACFRSSLYAKREAREWSVDLNKTIATGERYIVVPAKSGKSLIAYGDRTRGRSIKSRAHYHCANATIRIWNFFRAGVIPSAPEHAQHLTYYIICDIVLVIAGHNTPSARYRSPARGHCMAITHRVLRRRHRRRPL
jgi:hypothetical protein